MMAIIITACLVSDGSTCRDHRIPLNHDVVASHCMLHAPPHFAKWASEHPEWRIMRWRCRPVSEDDI